MFIENILLLHERVFLESLSFVYLSQHFFGELYSVIFIFIRCIIVFRRFTNRQYYHSRNEVFIENNCDKNDYILIEQLIHFFQFYET